MGFAVEGSRNIYAQLIIIQIIFINVKHYFNYLLIISKSRRWEI
jgi:hypothetical protein